MIIKNKIYVACFAVLNFFSVITTNHICAQNNVTTAQNESEVIQKITDAFGEVQRSSNGVVTGVNLAKARASADDEIL
ncbi:MAG: hypothetical protein ACRC2T_10280, partial [Thermoguttaceae bacterium]